MGIYHFLNLFFYFEIFILITVLKLIIFKRVQLSLSKKQGLKLQNEISQIVKDCFEKKEIHFQKDLPFDVLLKVLEQYDHRLSGQEWQVVKKGLAEMFLLPLSRKWAKSWFWKRRNFAARVFALIPLVQDEALILRLSADHSFLVRSIACAALIRLESFKGLYKTLENMNQEPGYARYFYLDIISQGSSQVFQWVAEIAESHKELCLVCLEVFSIKTAPVPLSFLQKSLKSSDPEIQIAALEALIRNRQQGLIEIFLECLTSHNEKLRILGAKGLSNYPEEKSYLSLLKAEKDVSWAVRLECAKSLKILGQIKLLKDPQMVDYMLDFG